MLEACLRLLLLKPVIKFALPIEAAILPLQRHAPPNADQASNVQR